MMSITSVNRILSVIAIFIAWAPSLSTQNHYCSISKDHTLCKFQGIGPRCQNPYEVGIPTRDRNLIMELHNSLRQMVATGGERRGRPGPQPMAANMRQMEWDDELAMSAQRLAEQCKYTHDCLNCRKVDRFLTGQNLYQFSENLVRDGSNWEKAIMAWYDEVALFNPRSVDYFAFVKELGHYTAMLWADTYKVGCGYVYYKDGKWNRKLYVCNYGPAGNIITTQMYKRGSPCSDCPEGTSCSNQYSGLCSGGRGGGSAFHAPAPPPPAPVTPRPTLPPTTRRPTTTTTTTRRTTTTTTTTTPRPVTTRRTTTRRPITTTQGKIIFNDIDSNEIDNFQPLSNDIASRLNFPSKKNNYADSFFGNTKRAYETTTLIPRKIHQNSFNRFATTKRPTTTRRPITTRLTTTTTTTTRRPQTTRKPFTFSPRVYPDQNKQKNKINRFQQQQQYNTAVVSTTSKPYSRHQSQQAKDNRIPSETISIPQTQNRYSSNNNGFSKQKSSQPDTKILKGTDTPALSVEDSNSILLFCDFDFAKCPVRYTGDLWNYTAYETPGYGHGFATIIGPKRESSLQIRSDVYPSGTEGLICVHFRFVHYIFGVDGGPARTNGLAPDGQPIKFSVSASSATQVQTAVEISERSKSAYDWNTVRIQFRDLHSMFLLNFHVPRNPIRDNIYVAVDDILITQGVCHT